MKKEPFIFHSPLLKGMPRVTIVGQIEGNMLLIGAARCSEQDHFVKKTGVALAKSRIEKGELITTLQLSEPSISYSEFIDIALTLVDSIFSVGLKPIVLMPVVNWEWITREDFNEMEIEFKQENNLDEEGFVLYEK